MLLKPILTIVLIFSVSTPSLAQNVCASFYKLNPTVSEISGLESIKSFDIKKYLELTPKIDSLTKQFNREIAIKLMQEIDRIKYGQSYWYKLTHIESPLTRLSKEVSSSLRNEWKVRKMERLILGEQLAEESRKSYIDKQLRYKGIAGVSKFVVINLFFYKLFGFFGYLPKINVLQPVQLTDEQLLKAMALNRQLKWNEITGLYGQINPLLQLTEKSKVLIMSLMMTSLISAHSDELQFFKMSMNSYFVTNQEQSQNVNSAKNHSERNLEAWKISYRFYIELEENRKVDFNTNSTDKSALEFQVKRLNAQ